MSLKDASKRGSRKRTDRDLLDLAELEEEETVRINVKLPKSLREEFKRKADEEGRTMSQIVRFWVERFVRT